MRTAATAAAAVTLALSGCAAHTLNTTIPPGGPPWDQSALSPGLRAKAYTRIMVVPPSGTARAEFEGHLNRFERSFLKRGITVISPAITGRVAAREKEGGVETGVTSLSDVERALILAKKTNAQAILQVGSWTWDDGGTRFFCGDTGDQLSECAAKTFETARFRRAINGGRTLIFLGRLIDVESGEVTASLDLRQGSLNNFPLTSLGHGQQFEVQEQMDQCSDKGSDVGRACLEAEGRTTSQVIEHVVGLVTQH